MNEDFVTSSLPAPYEKTSDAAYDISQDKSDEQKTIEKEQELEDYSLAALKDHPGWAKIRAKMEEDVESFRMLQNIDMKKYKNDELGELVRGEHMVAEKLQSYLNTIDEAVKAVHGKGK